MAGRCPARRLRRPVLAGGVVGAAAGQPSVAASCATPTRANGSTTTPSAKQWWTGDALPEAKVVRREMAGTPRIEVAGVSKEKVEELFWETVTQVRAELAGVPRK